MAWKFDKAGKASLVFAAAWVALGVQADDGSRFSEGIGYYVGIDSRVTFPSGTYAGQVNPNVGRLSFLFDHGDHYHGIGTYSLSGPAGAPVVEPTNANNRIPELYSRTGGDTDAIRLLPGSGAFAGGWASAVLPEGTATHDYSHLGVASVQSLNGLSPMADVLFHSSGDRWSALYQNVSVGLKLVSATPGLKLAAGGMMDIFGGGNTFTLGASDSFEFKPTYYVGAGAAAGVYTAQFQLVNLGSNLNARDGGNFYIDVSVPAIPEPGTWAMLAAGLLFVAVRARRAAASA